MSSIKIRTKLLNGVTLVRTLITHPMETGRSKDNTGKEIPPHFIQELIVKHNDRIIAQTFMASGISKNPFFAYKFKGGQSGDKITVSWVDNLGQSDAQERLLQ